MNATGSHSRRLAAANFGAHLRSTEVAERTTATIIVTDAAGCIEWVSARQLHDPDIACRLQAIVRDAGLSPELFELEITESSMMADPEGAVAIMEVLSNAGFALAIDDFGTGYSSLSYLKRFSVDQIKIDISFVRDMLSDKDDYAIVKAIIAMADSLGLKTTAEGVEDAAQAKALAILGCDFVQGYHFAHPQPAALFSQAWLARGQKKGEPAKADSPG